MQAEIPGRRLGLYSRHPETGKELVAPAASLTPPTTHELTAVIRGLESSTPTRLDW